MHLEKICSFYFIAGLWPLSGSLLQTFNPSIAIDMRLNINGVLGLVDAMPRVLFPKNVFHLGVFTGCLRNLHINSKRVLMSNMEEEYLSGLFLV